jgi:hypothetical protein
MKSLREELDAANKKADRYANLGRLSQYYGVFIVEVLH